jgi:hypothetical protein
MFAITREVERRKTGGIVHKDCANEEEKGACAISSQCLARWLGTTATANSPGPREGEQDVASPPFAYHAAPARHMQPRRPLVVSRLIIGLTKA